jgi:hypothetical protein
MLVYFSESYSCIETKEITSIEHLIGLHASSYSLRFGTVTRSPEYNVDFLFFL